MDNWTKLEELISLNQFELLLSNENKAGAAADLRLVYLMNDAAESFLIFRNAVMTGSYIKDFEGDIWADAEQAGARPYLILHQEDNVVTIFFDQLDFEVHLFDYSHVGHFWVDGYEYLRQLEYKLVVLGNKNTYIGAEVCTELERKLAALTEFPPLSYTCYSAVPEKYIVPREDPWTPSAEAIAVMREVAETAEDPSFAKLLDLYEKFPTRPMGKLVAGALHRTCHIKIAKTLMALFEEACAGYSARYTMDSNRAEFRKLQQKLSKAAKKMDQLRAKGVDADIYIEEPFWFAGDGITGKVFLAVWNYGRVNTRLTITEI